MGGFFLDEYIHVWPNILISAETGIGTMCVNGIFSKMLFILTPNLFSLCSNIQTWVFEILWIWRPFLMSLHWVWMVPNYFGFKSILDALSKPTERTQAPDDLLKMTSLVRSTRRREVLLTNKTMINNSLLYMHILFIYNMFILFTYYIS